MHKTIPLRYHMLVYRREQIWLPAGLWGLFALLVLFFHDDPTRAPDIILGFLNVVLPLMAGVLAASVVVEDPALELQLATPRPPWWLLLERLLLLLGLTAVAALAYQALLAAAGMDAGFLGNPLARQLVWLVPSLALMGLASVVALAFAQGMPGALVVGAMWLFQILFRDWLAASPWARFVFLFMGGMHPESPDLPANYLCLLALAAAFAVLAALMLQREERYL